jgi:hypothetical protein
MRKSFSIDSSLSMVSHHAAARTHPDRPADHGGHGMQLTGLKTLNEDRGASPPMLSPRSPPALLPFLPQQQAAEFQQTPGSSGHSTRRSPLRGWLLVAITALAALGLGIFLAESPLLGAKRDISADSIGAGCANIDALPAFDMARFAGDWHTIAWLHSSAEASAWEKVVSNKCTTARFAPWPASAREQSVESRSGGAGRTSSLKADNSANSTCSSNSSRGGGRGADFDVTFLHRPQPQDTPASGVSSSNRQQEATGLPTVVKGKGSVPLRASPARLQVHLDSGHVLPYHVVATDYTSWALMCTTSASLGGQRPAQVLSLLSRTWLHDRLDVGDRLNELADRNLPWKDVVFAPSAACAITAE